MKLISTIAFVILLTSVAFADWVPSDNPNPHGILIEARENTRNQRFEIALKKHLWFHQNALKFDPSLYGVRLSFALSDWLTLCLEYKPALDQLKNIRNDAEIQVKAGVHSFEFFHDFLSINSKIEENKRTVLLFKWLDINKPIIAQKVFKLAKPVLLKANENTICEKYVDTEKTSLTKARPSNELPMYGGEDKSHVEPNKDYSKGAAQLGWEYLMNGDFDTAIKRFNQAWMFNHNNVDALWGFGMITLQRAKQYNEKPLNNLKESVRFLEMARSLAPEELRLSVDLALSYIFLGNELKKESMDYEEEFTKAQKLLEKAKAIRQDYPMIYANLSVLEFYRGNYPKAKNLIDQAAALGFIVQPSYEKALNEKLK